MTCQADTGNSALLLSPVQGWPRPAPCELSMRLGGLIMQWMGLCGLIIDGDLLNDDIGALWTRASYKFKPFKHCLKKVHIPADT